MSGKLRESIGTLLLLSAGGARRKGQESAGGGDVSSVLRERAAAYMEKSGFSLSSDAMQEDARLLYAQCCVNALSKLPGEMETERKRRHGGEWDHEQQPAVQREMKKKGEAAAAMHYSMPLLDIKEQEGVVELYVNVILYLRDVLLTLLTDMCVADIQQGEAAEGEEEVSLLWTLAHVPEVADVYYGLVQEGIDLLVALEREEDIQLSGGAFSQLLLVLMYASTPAMGKVQFATSTASSAPDPSAIGAAVTPTSAPRFLSPAVYNSKLSLMLNAMNPLGVVELLGMLFMHAAPPADEKSGALGLAKQRVFMIRTNRCSSLLTRTMLRPGGFRATLRLLQQMNGMDATRVCKQATQVASNKPKKMSWIGYIRCIAPQILAILHIDSKSAGYEGWSIDLQAAVSVSVKLFEKQAVLTRQHILYEIIAPLLPIIRMQLATDHAHILEEVQRLGGYEEYVATLKEQEAAMDGKAEVAVEDLVHCVSVLQLFVSGGSPSQPLLEALRPAIPVLFQLYCFARGSEALLKRKAGEILACYLRTYEHGAAAFKDLLIPSEAESKVLGSAKHYSFSASTKKGLVDIVALPISARDYAYEAESMTSLVKEMEDREVAGNLFVDLLQEMQLLGAYAEEQLTRSARYMLLLQWLLKMMEEMGADLLCDVVQTCTFIKAMLSNRDAEILSLALGMLSHLLDGTTLKFTKEEEVLVFDLTEELEVIHLLPHLPKEVRDLAGVMRTRIVASDTKEWVMSDQEQMKHKADIGVKKRETLEEALAHLKDPLLPVRAHGLVALRRLVLDKDRNVAEANFERVLDVFQTQLNDSDSFVYGHAIAGLTALGDVQPARVVPLVTAFFMKENVPVETRLKTGEALMKIAQRCGETLPLYADQLVHAFLVVANNEDVTVKASCLSNLAEVCRTLKLGIHPFLEEIVSCVEAVLLTEKDMQVKRGAISVFYMLLDGLGTDAFAVMPHRIAGIYQQLRLFSSDEDAVTQFHANVALDELEDIVKAYLFPQGAEKSFLRVVDDERAAQLPRIAPGAVLQTVETRRSVPSSPTIIEIVDPE